VLGLAAVLVSFLGSQPAAAQEALLERWTLGHLAETWSPRWGMPDDRARLALPVGAARGLLSRPPLVWVSAEVEVLSLRETLYRDRSDARMGVRLPVGNSVGLQLSAATGRWETETADQPVLSTPRSEAVSLGLDVVFDVGPLGSLLVEALAGWDNGAGGRGRLVSGSRYHSFILEGWRTTSRQSAVTFPADSLRDLGVGHDVRGGEMRIELSVPVSRVTLRPSAVWRRELIDEATDVTEGFLTTTPEGGHTILDFGLGVEWGAWTAGAGYRERTSRMQGTFMRGTGQAGFVSQAKYDFWSWRAQIGRRIGDRQWVLEGGSEDLGGVLATRVETWPFVSFWESLSAIAYRFNGDVRARSQWTRLLNRRDDGGGWAWAVEVDRYTMQVERDSWYVTSFGFGRSDRQMTTDGADPAFFVGGEVSRQWTSRLGAVGVRLRGGIPVHVSSLDGGAPTGHGIAGYLGLGVEWARR